MTTQEPKSFGPALSGLAILTAIFFVNFLSRLALAPFLPLIEQDLGLDHTQAGSLFLYLSTGYFLALSGSGFVAARLTHRRTILTSAFLQGLAFMGLSLADDLIGLGLALFCIGLAAGLYLPSGMASIYNLVRKEDWGKAVTIHEMAPNLAFVLTPLICTWLIRIVSWQEAIGLMGVATISIGLIYLLAGPGGRFKGQAPTPAAIRELLANRSMLIMILYFGLAIGASLGIYTMMPLFLVAEAGLSQDYANTLLSMSRILCVGTGFLGGWLIDRLGVRRAIRIYIFISGLTTIFLGLTPDSLLEVAVIIQPLLMVCLFPAGFAALARIASAERSNLAISLAMPLGFIIGGGGVPTMIGFCGEMGSFTWGITGLGVLLLVWLLLLPLVRLNDR